MQGFLLQQPVLGDLDVQKAVFGLGINFLSLAQAVHLLLFLAVRTGHVVEKVGLGEQALQLLIHKL